MIKEESVSSLPYWWSANLTRQKKRWASTNWSASCSKASVQDLKVIGLVHELCNQGAFGYRVTAWRRLDVRLKTVLGVI